MFTLCWKLTWSIFRRRLIFYGLFWIVMFRDFCYQMRFTYLVMPGPRSQTMNWEIGSRGKISAKISVFLELFSESVGFFLKLEWKICVCSSYSDANIHLIYVLDSFPLVNCCRYLPGGNEGTEDVSNFLLLVSDFCLDVLSSV